MQPSALIILALTGLSLAGTSLTAQARIKCWTNDEGVRECGEAVPPEYSQKGHEELNEQGMVIDEQDRAKTREELAEEARRARIEAEKLRQKEKQAEKDQILLYTYSSVEDIELARDQQIKSLQANIKVTQKRSEKIRENLDKRTAKAAAAERSGEEIEESLLEDIESLERQFRNNEKFIRKRHNEIKKIKEEYAAKIERFKELKEGG